MTAATDEMRRRLDVPIDLVPDAVLDRFLTVAGTLIAPWLVPDPDPDLVAEGTIELALKVWDVSTRGAVGMDAVGEFLAPAPSATPGLVRSVFGVLGPALSTGGVSV